MCRTLAAILCAALLATPAHAFTCDQVRQYALGKTDAELHALARQYSISAANVAHVKACLSVTRRAARAFRPAR